MPWDKARSDENIQFQYSSTLAVVSTQAVGNYGFIARGDLPLPAEGSGRKVYWEMFLHVIAATGTPPRWGLATASAPSSGTVSGIGAAASAVRLGQTAESIGVGTTFTIITDSSTVYTASAAAPATSMVAGDLMRFAYDANTRQLWVGHAFNSQSSASWQKGADPSAGTNQTIFVASGQTWYPAWSGCSTQSTFLLDGARWLGYSPPNGFSTLSSALEPYSGASAIISYRGSTIQVDLGTRASSNFSATGNLFFISNTTRNTRVYWEAAVSTTGSSENGWGLFPGGNVDVGTLNDFQGFMYNANTANIIGFNVVYGSAGAGVSTLVAGDRAMFAYDRANGLVYIGKNGTWYKSADPSTPSSTTSYGAAIFQAGVAGPTAEIAPNRRLWFPSGQLSNGNAGKLVVKASEWRYAAPSGYTEWIEQPEVITTLSPVWAINEKVAGQQTIMWELQASAYVGAPITRQYAYNIANATTVFAADTAWSTNAIRTGASVTVSCAVSSVWFVIGTTQNRSNGGNQTAHSRILEKNSSTIMAQAGRDSENFGDPVMLTEFYTKVWEEPTGGSRNFEMQFGGGSNANHTRANGRLLAIRAADTDVYSYTFTPTVKVSSSLNYITVASVTFTPNLNTDYLFFAQVQGEAQDFSTGDAVSKLLINGASATGEAAFTGYQGTTTENRAVAATDALEMPTHSYVWKMMVPGNVATTIQLQVGRNNAVGQRFLYPAIIGLDMSKFQYATVVTQQVVSALASTLNAQVSAGAPIPNGIYPVTQTWTPSRASTVSFYGMFASRNPVAAGRSYVAHEVDGAHRVVSQEYEVFGGTGWAYPFSNFEIETMNVQKTQKSFIAGGSVAVVSQWNGIMWALELESLGTIPAATPGLTSMVFAICG